MGAGGDLLTTSRLRTWRSCQRRHQLRYELGLERTTHDPALHLGDLVHLGLEAWWNGMAQGVEGDEQLDLALAAIEHETDPFEQARAAAMLTGYHHRWEGRCYEVLGVELEFRAPLVDPATGELSRHFTRAGKLDVLVRELDGRRHVLIVEHKTSAEDISAGSTYWQRLRLDSQVSAYFDGAAALGYPAEACVYDVLGKLDLRPLKATPLEQRQYTKPKTAKHDACKGKGCADCTDGKVVTEPSRLYANQREQDETPAEFQARLLPALAEDPARYYARGEVVRLEAEMHRHRADVWTQAHAIYLAAWSGESPKNPESCFAYRRACPYLPLCTGEASPDDDRYQHLEHVHTELSATDLEEA